MAVPKLYINRLARLDWLIALEFGRVDEGQPPENWAGVSQQFGYLLERPGGAPVGFKVLDFSSFDPNAPEVEEIWTAAYFEVPMLGLPYASAGEIIVATRALLGDEQTINRDFFDAAMGLEGEEALSHWLACLQAGDSMAHFALGSTLFELGRFNEAYRHLRYYTELAPRLAWAWSWYGKAAQAIGELDEARAAYERAIELEHDDPDEQTDAQELLDELGGVD